MQNSFHRTRFAPSPTGAMHLGNARTALFNRLAAGADGEMILRIEDTDAARGGARYVDAILRDLAWLGIQWRGADANRPLRQSDSAAQHAQMLDELLRNNAAYPCFCPPEMLQAERETALRAGKPPRYSGRCAAIPAAEAKRRTENGESAAIRFRMPAREIVFDDIVRGECRFRGADIGDFVVRRADGAFSFFFANAADDATQKITHVLRGEDHLSNTPRQIALLRAMNLPIPKYGHLPLMRDSDGAPLSKRDGAISVRELRERGFVPAAVVNYLARAGCTIADDSIADLESLAKMFSPSKINAAPSAFDAAQLYFWQKRAIQNLSAAEYAKWLAAALPKLCEKESFAEFCDSVRENVALYKDAQEWADIVFGDSDSEDSANSDLHYSETAKIAIQNAGADFFATATAAISETADSQTATVNSETENSAAANLEAAKTEWKSFCDSVSQKTGQKGGALFKPLRAALTGRTDGPAMPPLLKLIGKKTARARLSAAAKI